MASYKMVGLMHVRTWEKRNFGSWKIKKSCWHCFKIDALTNYQLLNVAMA